MPRPSEVSSGNDWTSISVVDHRRQAARVDAVDGDVGARRRGNHVARRVHDVVASAVVEDVVDVVVDAFAEQHQGLAAAADVAEVLREVLDGVERVARLEAALLVVDVVDPVALLPACRACALYVVDLFSVDERSLRPMNLSTDRSSRRWLLVKSCAASDRPLV